MEGNFDKSFSNSSDEGEDESILQSKEIILLKSMFENRPATVFFQSRYKENNIDISGFEFVKFDPKSKKMKKFCIRFKAYHSKIPKCVIEPLNENGILRTFSDKRANLVWKLQKYEKILKLVPKLKKYQRFNHFPTTWQLGRKDNLYKNYKIMKRSFPDEYDYMPTTFILPQDYNEFTNYYKQYPKLMYIIKPCGSSRGRGISLLTNPESIPKSCLISRYIERPLIINKRKFDLRLYLVITSFNPLKIYLFKEGLVRFASEDYNHSNSKQNKSNIYAHITNYSINKKNINFDKDNINSNNECSGSKWTLRALENYFKSMNINYSEIQEKIKDILIKTIISVSDKAIHLVKLFTKHKNVMFELYGFDIILDEYLNPWLLEVNVNPSLECDTELDMKVKTTLMTNIFNLIGLVPYDCESKNKNKKYTHNYHEKVLFPHMIPKEKKESELVLPVISNAKVGVKKTKSKVISKKFQSMNSIKPNKILSKTEKNNEKIMTDNYSIDKNFKFTNEIKKLSTEKKLSQVNILGKSKENIEIRLKTIEKTTQENLMLKKEILNKKIKICKEFDFSKPDFHFESTNITEEYREMILDSEDEYRRKGEFERIFPTIDNITFYYKFFKEPGDENIIFWKWIKSNKPYNILKVDFLMKNTHEINNDENK